MWRDKWFYDFWFRGGEHRMTLIKVSHAGPPVVPYPMESSYTIDSAAVDFVALLVCYIGLFLSSKTKEGRSAWLSLSLSLSRARVREACLLTDAGMMSSTNPAHIYGSRPQSGRGSVNVLRLIATNE